METQTDAAIGQVAGLVNIYFYRPLSPNLCYFKICCPDTVGKDILNASCSDRTNISSGMGNETLGNSEILIYQTLWEASRSSF